MQDQLSFIDFIVSIWSCLNFIAQKMLLKNVLFFLNIQLFFISAWGMFQDTLQITKTVDLGFFVWWHIKLFSLFNAKVIWVEEQYWYYLTYSLAGNGGSELFPSVWVWSECYSTTGVWIHSLWGCSSSH